jgi:phosphate transport system substrate-binding protein
MTTPRAPRARRDPDPAATRPCAPVVALLLWSLALAAASFAAPAAAQSVIRIDGSSTLYPLSEAAAREHQVRLRGLVRVPVEISGTRGGFRKFCRGEIELQDASRPILADEQASCRANGVRFIELPIAYDALTVAVSTRNRFATRLRLDDLRRLWQRREEGARTTWQTVDAGWPATPLALYGPGADSGTLDYFIEAVIGEGGAIRRDYHGSEDDQFLAAAIADDPAALGILPYAYAIRNADRLRLLPVDAVSPSVESVTAGLYQPLSRPLFLYVAERAAARPDVREFVRHYLADAPRLASRAGLVPLPREAYAIVAERFRQQRLGTAFDGRSAVGLSFDQLLQRESAP